MIWNKHLPLWTYCLLPGECQERLSFYCRLPSTPRKTVYKKTPKLDQHLLKFLTLCFLHVMQSLWVSARSCLLSLVLMICQRRFFINHRSTYVQSPRWKLLSYLDLPEINPVLAKLEPIHSSLVYPSYVYFLFCHDWMSVLLIGVLRLLQKVFYKPPTNKP